MFGRSCHCCHSPAEVPSKQPDRNLGCDTHGLRWCNEPVHSIIAQSVDLWACSCMDEGGARAVSCSCSEAGAAAASAGKRRASASARTLQQASDSTGTLSLRSASTSRRLG